MDIEHLILLCVFFVLAAVVVVKIATTQRIARMERDIAGVEQEKQKQLKALGGIQHQKNIIEQKKTVWLQKKSQLEKRKARLRAEMAALEAETAKRRLQQTGLRGGE